MVTHTTLGLHRTSESSNQIRSFVRPLVRSFVRSSVRSFVSSRLFVHRVPGTQLMSIVHVSLVRSFIRSTVVYTWCSTRVARWLREAPIETVESTSVKADSAAFQLWGEWTNEWTN